MLQHDVRAALGGDVHDPRIAEREVETPTLRFHRRGRRDRQFGGADNAAPRPAQGGEVAAEQGPEEDNRAGGAAGDDGAAEPGARESDHADAQQGRGHEEHARGTHDLGGSQVSEDSFLFAGVPRRAEIDSSSFSLLFEKFF